MVIRYSEPFFSQTKNELSSPKIVKKANGKDAFSQPLKAENIVEPDESIAKAFVDNNEIPFTATVKTYDKKQALETLNLNVFKHQRKLSPGRVRMLATEMKRGTFRPTEAIMIATFMSAGRFHDSILINGQHTLNAIVETDVKLTLPTIVYSVTTDEQVASLYGVTDINMRRSLYDGIRAYGDAYIPNIPQSSLRNIFSAIALIEDNFNVHKNTTTSVSREVLAHKLLAWRPVIERYYPKITGADSDAIGVMLRGKTFHSVGLVLERDCPDKATQFFKEILGKEEIILRDSPTTKLRELMFRHRNIAFMGATREGVIKGINIIVDCWNHFYKGDTFKSLHKMKTTCPIIYGTAFAKERK